MIFSYSAQQNPGPTPQRVVMLVRPVEKSARTGNMLLTAVNVPYERGFDEASLNNLYKTRVGSIPEDQYRTFIMTRIVGPLYRVKGK